MTHAEFSAQMQRIVSVYSERVYSTERIAIIFNAVKNYPVRTFAAAVDDMIGDCMQPPSLTKIREYLMLAQKKFGDMADAWQPIRDEIAAAEKAKGDHCHMCFDSGVFMAHRRDDEHQFLRVFLCSCRMGHLAGQLPENRGKCPEWTILTAKTWRRDMEAEPPRRVTESDKRETRGAISSLFRSTDLRNALDGTSGPKRERDLEHDFDPEL